MNNTAAKVSQDIIKKIYERTIFHFKAICGTYPRGSKKESGICCFIKEFVNGLKEKGIDIDLKHQSETREGKPINNIVITKPASKGYENAKKVALQAHLDMVCQKVEGSKHNFDTMPIKFEINGNLMTSENKETTLGADDGIGIACIMAILESTELSHPQIQAVLTSDEEDGMSGAKWLDTKLVDADCFINIDAEEDGVLYYGCAGGIYAKTDIPVKYMPKPEDTVLLNFEISGLLGGHSGIKIGNKHANANRLMGRALNYFINDFSKTGDKIFLANISGGDVKNAITKKASVVAAVKNNQRKRFEKKAQEIEKIFKYEYGMLEQKLAVKTSTCEDCYENVMSEETLKKIITMIMTVPNGVLDMYIGDKELTGKLVETSSNLGIVKLNGTSVSVVCFVRSFIESKKRFAAEQIRLIAESIGAGFAVDTDFPEWNPDFDSGLVKLFKKTYKDIFDKELSCESIHAGLECGYFFKAFYNPQTQKSADFVAVGPTLHDVHVPEETLYLDTVEPLVALLLNVFANMTAYSQ